MRIVYVAKHNSGGNDDEGAIADAFTKLGCEVVCVDERTVQWSVPEGDLLLFHKWRNVRLLKTAPCRRTAFWFFDLVQWPSDPTLQRRDAWRLAWMREVVPYVDIGFCTDGDFCSGNPKLKHLPQGADQRLIREPRHDPHQHGILFTGISAGGGVRREAFVHEMRQRYGSDFHHFTGGLHGEPYRQAVERRAYVVCPDSPVTNRYWSNRVYNALLCGGFVLHMGSLGLMQQLMDGVHLRFYVSIDHLSDLISMYADKPAQRADVAAAGMRHVEKNHTYVNRCAQLLEMLP